MTDVAVFMWREWIYDPASLPPHQVRLGILPVGRYMVKLWVFHMRTRTVTLAVRL